MIWLSLIILLLLICFGGVLLVGAPYLPTLTPQIGAALELADVRAGATLLELGCGDGKVVLAAARSGARVIGYELNPVLVVIAWLRTWRYRRQVTIIWGNFWSIPLPQAEAIFVFLLPKYMSRLDTKIMQSKHKPVKLVSFAFPITGRQPVGQKLGVYRYDYAKVARGVALSGS